MSRSAIPMVLASLTVVKGPNGAYVRSKHNVVVSPRLAKRNACIATQMRGTHGTQAQIQDAFKAASATCRTGGAEVGRRMSRFRR